MKSNTSWWSFMNSWMYIIIIIISAIARVCHSCAELKLLTHTPQIHKNVVKSCKHNISCCRLFTLQAFYWQNTLPQLLQSSHRKCNIFVTGIYEKCFKQYKVWNVWQQFSLKYGQAIWQSACFMILFFPRAIIIFLLAAVKELKFVFISSHWKHLGKKWCQIREWNMKSSRIKTLS